MADTAAKANSASPRGPDGGSPASSVWEEHARSVRERILEAALRVVESGTEPTMRAVAKEARLSERTAYRYFATRGKLLAALMPELRCRASTPMAPDVAGLEDYARRLFTTFDANAALARALATARWVPTNRTRPENLRALRRVIDQGFPSAPEEARAAATGGLRPLLSAAGWSYLADCGFDLEASVAHAQWLIRTVLEKLERLEKGDHDACR